MQTLKPKNMISVLLLVGSLINSIPQTAIGQETGNSNHAGLSSAQEPARFETTLRKFVNLAAEDEGVRALLAKHRVTLEYTVSELGIHFFIGSDGRAVVSGFGQPRRSSEISFISNARTLERLLKGEDCFSEMEVSVQLNLIRKIQIRKDLAQLRAALARVYKIAGEHTQAAPQIARVDA